MIVFLQHGPVQISNVELAFIIITFICNQIFMVQIILMTRLVLRVFWDMWGKLGTPEEKCHIPKLISSKILHLF